MRIVIDLQGAQTESRYRGIGRYSLSFAKAIAKNRKDHEIIIALSGLFPETIEPIRDSFRGILPDKNIIVWHAPGPVQEEGGGNDARRNIAELIRINFLTQLHPDIVHTTSLFEGFIDDAVTGGTVRPSFLVSNSLYDLIPLCHPKEYLEPNPPYAEYYQRKLTSLNQSDLLLAISDHSRREGLAHLCIPEERIVNVSTATSSFFHKREIGEQARRQILNRLNIRENFILYTGGYDDRKNIPRLIAAYACLPQSVKKKHQLVLVGRIPDGKAQQLREIAKEEKVSTDEYTLTGYISDDDLASLYNLCSLFAFPSWDEGFGLPPLEAMLCGATVVAGNTTSVPEVVGFEEALFDPFSTASISQKMHMALTNQEFRERFALHGEQYVKRFSWDITAQKAIEAFEDIHKSKEDQNIIVDVFEDRKLIHGIANFATSMSAEEVLSTARAINENNSRDRQLLVDISEIVKRDGKTGVQRVVRNHLVQLLLSPPEGYRIRTVYAESENSGYVYAEEFLFRYARGVASDEGKPIEYRKNDIFFALDLQHGIQIGHASLYDSMKSAGVFVVFMLHDLLPIQLKNFFYDQRLPQMHSELLHVMAKSNAVISVSKATCDAFKKWLIEEGYNENEHPNCPIVYSGAEIKEVFQKVEDHCNVEKLLPIIERPSFLLVSTLEPRKKQDQVVDAFSLLWDKGIDINLVLVGRQGWQVDSLVARIRNHDEYQKHLFWLEGISDEELEDVYRASTCLIAASLNEGFGLSLIEGARNGLPIMARDIPVFREVAGDNAFYFSGESGADLAGAVEQWLSLFYAQRHPLSVNMHWLTWKESSEALKQSLATLVAPPRQLFVDISELVQRDAKSGIQRVVRSVLREWLTNPPQNISIEPVYATIDATYKYARKYTSDFLGLPNDHAEDEPIVFSKGDIFLGLDLQPVIVPQHSDFFNSLRGAGVEVLFLVYDLLPVQLANCFPEGAKECFENWLQEIVRADGALCISKATAQQLQDWVGQNAPERKDNFSIKWFHIGATIEDSVPSKGMPESAGEVLASFAACPTFLMVGTLEPRKGYNFIIDAFEHLWGEQVDANLVIVGKPGWKVDKLVDRINKHSEYNRRLFWLYGVSDEYLGEIYSNSTCLIAGSLQEGFGLPLIEAARLGLPVIARDIPVFHEVAGEHAFYFKQTAPLKVAEEIKQWLELYKQGQHPSSEKMSWLTWKESAIWLFDSIMRMEGASPDPQLGNLHENFCS